MDHHMVQIFLLVIVTVSALASPFHGKEDDPNGTTPSLGLVCPQYQEPPGNDGDCRSGWMKSERCCYQACNKFGHGFPNADSNCDVGLVKDPESGCCRSSITCSIGSEMKGGACHECPEGRYRDSENMEICQPCLLCEELLFRDVIQPCTSTTPAVCGECLKGYAVDKDLIGSKEMLHSQMCHIIKQDSQTTESSKGRRRGMKSGTIVGIFFTVLLVAVAVGVAFVGIIWKMGKCSIRKQEDSKGTASGSHEGDQDSRQLELREGVPLMQEQDVDARGEENKASQSNGSDIDSGSERDAVNSLTENGAHSSVAGAQLQTVEIHAIDAEINKSQTCDREALQKAVPYNDPDEPLAVSHNEGQLVTSEQIDGDADSLAGDRSGDGLPYPQQETEQQNQECDEDTSMVPKEPYSDNVVFDDSPTGCAIPCQESSQDSLSDDPKDLVEYSVYQPKEEAQGEEEEEEEDGFEDVNEKGREESLAERKEKAKKRRRRRTSSSSSG